MAGKDKNKDVNLALCLVLYLVALIAFAGAVSAENMKITYYTSRGTHLQTNYSLNRGEFNITLPNTTWDVELANEVGVFSILFRKLNYSSSQPLNVTARTVDLGIQDYTTSLGNSNDYDYYIHYAYALNITPLGDRDYTVYFNYSGYPSMRSPMIFKCNHSFVTNETNMSTCSLLSEDYHDAASDRVWANSTGFSSFFLVEDHCNNGAQDYGESGTDCGGSCVACPSGGSTGGGGGGGGGGSSGPKVVYVTPTPEGETVKVYQGDELIVIFNDKEYHYRITQVGDWKVKMRSMATYIEHEFNLGEFTQIGLTSFLAKEVEVSMYVSNRFAALTFKTVEKPRFSIPLLPPRPRTTQPAQEGGTVRTPGVLSPRTAPATQPAAPAATTAPRPSALEVPESPINIWTILVALVFVIFLVGGIALYRAKLHHLEKPPTVTRTGLEPVGLPETSTSAPKPAHPSSKGGEVAGISAAAGAAGELSKGVEPSVMSPVEKKVPEKAAEKPEKAKAEAPAEKQVQIPAEPEHKVEYYIPRAKKLELERYVFHSYSMGFSEAQVKKALIEKGWPEELVDELMSEIRHKDYE
ncbi:hypothetical protein KY362_03575 [Candidatus Woesearchaeota archaeon]|nr:hypothetical protein [Candidatus Woesearchaeota archaeon]